MALNVVIMAAGKGTRMHSDRPKVLLELAGASLLHHVLATVAELTADRTVVVVGHGAEAVEAALAGSGAVAVRQTPQRGTGHAVQQAVPWLDGGPEGVTLILNGDTPLLRADTARSLVAAAQRGGGCLALLTARLTDPAGYGRILRSPAGTAGDIGTAGGAAGADGAAGAAGADGADGGSSDGRATAAGVAAIVEDKDATAAQRAITEVYTGTMAVPTAALLRWLPQLTDGNAQRELYLTDIVALAVAEGGTVVASPVADTSEALGVNTPRQLAALERRLQARRADALLDAGVRLADPARIDVRGALRCGRDVEIDIGCIFAGSVALGDGVRVGAHCVLRNATVGAGTEIHPYTHIDGGSEGVAIGARAAIGPYARLRPGATLADEVHIGNFVEVKNSQLGRGSKANHLAYLGDATVGVGVNVGAGSITANYDGARKHRTVIGDGAHIGSNCVLVAPVAIGSGATIGGGSTITRDAPADALSVARARQVVVPGWQRPRKG